MTYGFARLCRIAAATACVAGVAAAQPPAPPRKPQMADTIRANIYADNAFELYINGELVAVDSIRFIPHNVISIDLLPKYPMTIAVLARDNADPRTGMEYANTKVGDGGFILRFDDGDWKPAREYSEREIDPKQPYYDADFAGAKFIWTDDVKLDNTVVFRHVVPGPPDGRERPDFSNLNDVVPQGPPRGGGRRPGGRPR